ncbi:MAG: tail fiber protein [Pseudomonadota bacterium]
MKRLLMTATAAAALVAGLAPSANAQDAYLGEVRIFANTFCPAGWMRTDGQLLSPGSYPALFSLFGDIYGGNGVSTFALPDIRGRSPMHVGTGPGLTTRFQSQMLGLEDVVLIESEMPIHTHTIRASSAAPNTGSLNNAGWGDFGASFPAFNSGGPLDQTARSDVMSYEGGGYPHENMQPNTVLRFCISLDGIYPPRN